VRGLDIERLRPWVKFGVVKFTGIGAEAMEPALMSDPKVVVARINEIVTDGSICPESPELECGLSLGLRRALGLLGPAQPNGPRRVILLPTSGDYESIRSRTLCEGIRARATEIQQSESLLVTACAGDINACERTCLRNAVTQDRYHFRAQRWAVLDRVLVQLADASGPFNPIERLTVVDELPDELAYAGSDDPPDEVAGGRLTWAFDPTTMGPPSWAITRTYRAQALDCGAIQSSRQVTATIRYAAPWGGNQRTFGLPNPVLGVPCPTLTPSPTPSTTPPTPTPPESPTPSPTTPATGATTSPTPTATATTHVATPTSSPTLTPTRTPSPTSQASPTPSPRVRAIYLPHLVAYGCAGASRDEPWDVALLIDVSGSMVRPAGGAYGDRMRLEAARDIAARGILGGALRPGVDHAAVIQFGDGELLAPLGPCCAGARSALDRLRRLNWSYPWQALDHAWDELRGPRARAGGRPAIVLFTDLGAGDLGPADAALLDERALLLRAAGIDLYAVGLGDPADAAWLTRLTGSPRRVFLTRAIAGADPAAVIGRSLRCER